ncbi:MAG: hypothetical protein ACOCUU_03455 [Nanoarchaeota archaeon]
MSIKSPPKKCPVCQSTRFTVSKLGAECKRCGYTNKTSEEINKEIKFKEKEDSP